VAHPLVAGAHALGRRVVFLARRRSEPLRPPPDLALCPAGTALEILGRAFEAIPGFVDAVVDHIPRALDGVGERLSRTIHHFVVGHLFLLAGPPEPVDPERLQGPQSVAMIPGSPVAANRDFARC